MPDTVISQPGTPLGHLPNPEEQAEVLEWTGNAYGRIENATEPAVDAEVETASASTDAGQPRDPLSVSKPGLDPARVELHLRESARTFFGEHPKLVMAGVAGLLGAVLLLVAIDALNDPSGAVNVTEVPKLAPLEVSRSKSEAPIASPSDGQQRVASEQRLLDVEAQLAEAQVLRSETERSLAEARAELADEKNSRAILEAKIAELTATLATQTQAVEAAERNGAEAKAQLAAERQARAEAERAVREAEAALTSAREQKRVAAMAVPTTPASAPAAHPASEPDTAVSIEAAPSGATSIAKPKDTPVIASKLDTPSRIPAKSSGKPLDANSAVRKGQERLAKGDLAAAREHFEHAAALGLPEGALALGNTYDKVSLSRAGLKFAGDPDRARRWYRRAYELAQHQR